MDYIINNREVWDKKVDSSYVWTKPISTDKVEEAKLGKQQIYLTPMKPASREWFPESLIGQKVLCLASGGGQQGPIMAAGFFIAGFYEDKGGSALDQYTDSSITTKAIKL